MKFHYTPLNILDLELLLDWQNQPHVKKWYSKKTWTYDDLKKKYLPYISKEKDIHAFIAHLDGNPIGYLQYYPVKKYLWAEHELGNIVEGSAGIDLFIGEKKHLGKGLSKPMIDRFLKARVFKNFAAAVVDPHIKNTRAIKCYKSCGFSIHKTIFSQEGEAHLLMVRSS